MKAEFRDDYTKIGLKISYYRKLKSLTQEQLAEKLNCGVSFSWFVLLSPTSFFTLETFPENIISDILIEFKILLKKQGLRSTQVPV